MSSDRLPSVRVAAALRARIAAGEWEPDSRLPAVAELAEFYAVARNTVRKAERILEAEGLVDIVANYGTFRTAKKFDSDCSAE